MSFNKQVVFSWFDIQLRAKQTAHLHISLCKWGHFERAKTTLKMLLASWFLMCFFKRFRSFFAVNMRSLCQMAAKLLAIKLCEWFDSGRTRTWLEQACTQFGLNGLFSTSKFWVQGGYNSFYGVSGGLGLTVSNAFSIGKPIDSKLAIAPLPKSIKRGISCACANFARFLISTSLVKPITL